MCLQLLTSVPSVARASLQASTLATAHEYEREARRRIQHMNIAGADLEVKSPKKNALSAFGGGDDWENSMGGGRTLRSFHA